MFIFFFHHWKLKSFSAARLLLADVLFLFFFPALMLTNFICLQFHCTWKAFNSLQHQAITACDPHHGRLLRNSLPYLISAWGSTPVASSRNEGGIHAAFLLPLLFRTHIPLLKTPPNHHSSIFKLILRTNPEQSSWKEEPKSFLCNYFRRSLCRHDKLICVIAVGVVRRSSPFLLSFQYSMQNVIFL